MARVKAGQLMGFPGRRHLPRCGYSKKPPRNGVVPITVVHHSRPFSIIHESYSWYWSESIRVRYLVRFERLGKEYYLEIRQIDLICYWKSWSQQCYRGEGTCRI